MKKILSGVAASPGIAKGKVKILLSENSMTDFPENTILVTTLTNPSMVKAMIKAAAIVTDIGGITSHPAILSREMGIPCVVNTKDATKILRDGSNIVVDGNTGEIYEQEASWIQDFAKGSFLLTQGQSIDGYQPLDFFHFFPMWYDLWVERIASVIDELHLEEKSFSELKHLLPSPSNIRSILIKMFPSILGKTFFPREEYKKVAQFFARMLKEGSLEDPFACKKNIIHSEEELKEFLQKISFENGNPENAKIFGQLITALGSHVHGLYNDVVTDFGWDAYGPYEIHFENEPYAFLIRHFSHMMPEELWPQEFLLSQKEIFMFGLYQGVKWEIGYVGCHTIPTIGSPIQGLKKFAIIADGKALNEKEIFELKEEAAWKATSLYQEIHKFDFESLKEKTMLQECYQLKKLFDASKYDWKPTQEMLVRIEGKPLLSSIIPKGIFMETLEQHIEIFGIRKFAKEIFGENI